MNVDNISRQLSETKSYFNALKELIETEAYLLRHIYQFLKASPFLEAMLENQNDIRDKISILINCNNKIAIEKSWLVICFKEHIRFTNSNIELFRSIKESAQQFFTNYPDEKFFQLIEKSHDYFCGKKQSFSTEFVTSLLDSISLQDYFNNELFQPIKNDNGIETGGTLFEIKKQFDNLDNNFKSKSRFISEASMEDSPQNFSIKSYLQKIAILPVQRFLKYELLFKKLLDEYSKYEKNPNDKTTDYLKDILDKINHIAKIINATKGLTSDEIKNIILADITDNQDPSRAQQRGYYLINSIFHVLIKFKNDEKINTGTKEKFTALSKYLIKTYHLLTLGKLKPINIILEFYTKFFYQFNDQKNFQNELKIFIDKCNTISYQQEANRKALINANKQSAAEKIKSEIKKHILDILTGHLNKTKTDINTPLLRLLEDLIKKIEEIFQKYNKQPPEQLIRTIKDNLVITSKNQGLPQKILIQFNKIKDEIIAYCDEISIKDIASIRQARESNQTMQESLIKMWRNIGLTNSKTATNNPTISTSPQPPNNLSAKKEINHLPVKERAQKFTDKTKEIKNTAIKEEPQSQPRVRK